MFKTTACRFAVLSTFLASCVEVRDPNVDGPEPPGDLVVIGAADPATVFEGGSVSLSVTVEGGQAPYTLRWDQNSGPAVSIESELTANASVDSISEPGHYVFRITATDQDGIYVDDFVTVEVLEAVTVDGPEFAVVGEPEALTAEVAIDSETPTFLWEITEGTADLDDPASSAPLLTARAPETVRVRLTVTFAGSQQSAATRELDIVAIEDLTPEVRVETSMGDFVIELDGQNTPRHMVNFLRYVDAGFYDGLLFHRNACTQNQETGECDPFVLQGGGYRRVDGEIEEAEPLFDPVQQENETSRSNGELYTVALALRGGPNTGTSQFYINLSEENAPLDDSGFTVFGLVTEGTDVVDAIVATDRVASPIILGEVSFPAEDIVIEQIVRVGEP